jgi:hypothetical protein
MPRVAFAVAAVAAFLTACSPYQGTTARAPAQPPGKPIFITLQVQQHLNKYYQQIAGGRGGAFAVSPKGTVGYYAFCAAVQCREEFSYTRAALQGCEARGQGPCVIIAVGHEVRRPYMTYQEAEAKGLL